MGAIRFIRHSAWVAFISASATRVASPDASDEKTPNELPKFFPRDLDSYEKLPMIQVGRGYTDEPAHAVFASPITYLHQR